MTLTQVTADADGRLVQRVIWCTNCGAVKRILEGFRGFPLITIYSARCCKGEANPCS